MTILIKICQLFMAFSLLVGIHELGHFIMARVFKIRVEKFYIFFNPWFSLFKFKRGETEYGLGWLPLGGYVKIAGMIDESMDKEQMAQPVKEDEFRAKPAWQRLMVMLAGVVMNVILAIAIYIGVCFAWGDTYFANEDAKWGYNYNEAAHSLGFVDGDKVISIGGQPIDKVDQIPMALLMTKSTQNVVVERNGVQTELSIPLSELVEFRKTKGYENMSMLRVPFMVDSVNYASARMAGVQHGDVAVAFNGEPLVQIQDYIDRLSQSRGQTVEITFERGGDLYPTLLPVDDDGRIGVLTANPYALRTQEYTFWEAIPAGFKRAGNTIDDYWQQLKLIVQPKTQMYEELGGFVAIGSIFPSEWNWEDFWLKTAFLSVILAVMNVLPIPGLDGGHALFTLWEIVTRRRPSEKFLERAQYVGLVIILALLIYANGNDIYRFFIK